MRGLWVVVAVAVAGCAKGGDPIDTPGAPSFPNEPQGDATTGATTGEGTAGTAAPVVSGGLDETGTGHSDGSSLGSSSTSGAANDDGTSDGDSPAVCPPELDDDACFSCARISCCVQVQACEADPICECTADCIKAGGEAQMCNEDCGGGTVATVNLLGCTNFQCDDVC